MQGERGKKKTLVPSSWAASRHFGPTHVRHSAILHSSATVNNPFIVQLSKKITKHAFWQKEQQTSHAIQPFFWMNITICSYNFQRW